METIVLLSVDPRTVVTHSELIIFSSNDETNITMVSQLLPINTFRLSSSNELSQLPTSTELDTFFRSKHDEYTSAGASNFFKIYGATSSCNSVILSLLYEYPPISNHANP